MKLQLALDTLNLEESINLLSELHQDIDIIEIGTPFIIESGVQPVTTMKAKFPNAIILADTKIMDAGGLEASAAFKAGADIVTVLGVSNDATILETVKAAKQYHKQVMVDMIAVKNLKARTIEIDQMGVDYICVHTAYDVQAFAANPLAELLTVNQVIKNAKSAVAGGVKLAIIDEIVKAKPEIIVVGGAIINALDQKEMTKAIKMQMLESESN